MFRRQEIQYLLIIGHGTEGGFRISRNDNAGGWIGKSHLYEEGNVNGEKTALGKQFESLKEFLDVNQSIVILDHCQTGMSENAIIRLSKILGGVNVRSFINSILGV